MTSPLADANLTASSPSVYTDLNGLSALKREAKTQSPEALRKVAQQFESIFAKMVLSSMRKATFGDSLFGSEQQQFYQGMFDDQLAVELTKGKGLGLADMLVQQLTRAGLVKDVASGDDKSGASAGGASPSGARAGSAPQSDTVSAADIADKNRALSIGASAGAEMKRDFLLSAARGAQRTLDGASSALTGPSAFGASSALDRASTFGASSALNSASAFGASSARTASSALGGGIGSPEEFVQTLWPCAQEAGKALGVDPRHLLAQAALETGWGKSLPCGADGKPSFNFFGIKAGGSWQGDSVSVKTLEFEGGVPTPRQAKFRSYDSAADSFRDYVEVLRNNPRYAAALNTGSDSRAFASALQRGGYATDPRYASKLMSIAQNLAAPAPLSDTALKSSTSAPMTQPMDLF